MTTFADRSPIENPAFSNWKPRPSWCGHSFITKRTYIKREKCATQRRSHPWPLRKLAHSSCSNERTVCYCCLESQDQQNQGHLESERLWQNCCTDFTVGIAIVWKHFHECFRFASNLIDVAFQPELPRSVEAFTYSKLLLCCQLELQSDLEIKVLETWSNASTTWAPHKK